MGKEHATYSHCSGTGASSRCCRTAGQFDPARPFQVFVQLLSSLFWAFPQTHCFSSQLIVTSSPLNPSILTARALEDERLSPSRLERGLEVPPRTR
jgi:hypothetical protein